MKLSRSKLFWSTAVILVVIGGGWAALRAWSAPVAARYVTTPAVMGDVEDTVLATGVIQALTQVNVGAQVSGQLQALHVALGDRVTQGQVVAEIDSLPQQNALRNAEASLAVARAKKQASQASLKQAQLNYTRQKRLYDQDAGSRQDLETAEAALNTLRADIVAQDAQILQAEVAVDTARLNLDYTRITSPIDGVVVAVVTKQGQTVNANQQAPTLIKVAQLDTLTIKAEISEADVIRVQAGQPVYFTVLGEPGKRRSAVLREVEPAPASIQNEDSNSASATTAATTAVYYNGRFDVPNEDGKLRISMTAQVYIVLDQVKDVVTIPSSALRETGRGASVRVLDKDGQARMQEVKVGLNNMVTAQIVEGLQAGDLVVLGETGAGQAPVASSGRRGPSMRF
jgi:macrolide-specific efflux system membrane fusion protein